MDWLGNTLEAIGREKAGIFRAGRPAVLGTADLPQTLWNAIEETGALAVVPGRDYIVSKHAAGWDFEQGGFALRNLPLPNFAGVHQLGNAATALAAIVALAAGADLKLTHADVSQALRSVKIRGRFQRVPGEVEWIFDVAHNVPAALGLAANLRELPRVRTVGVCGILGDKDIQGVAAALAACIDAWILVTLKGPRAVSTDELARRLPAGATILGHASDVKSGCRMARDAAQPGNRILVFGSFLTVGPALEFLGL